LFIALLVVGMLFLVLTKSRASLGALLAALFVLWALGGQRQAKVVAVLGLAWVASMVVLVASLGGFDIEGSTADVALMGRHDSTASLNGRTQLWEELANYVWERPLVGYGYDSFWEAEHIQDVSSHLQWTINTAHSSYLDTLLAVGLIGAGMLLAAMMLGFAEAVRRHREFGGVGVAFTIGLLTYTALNGLLESGFPMPTSFVQFVMVGCVMHLALCPPDVEPRNPENALRYGTSTKPSYDSGEPVLQLSIPEHESPST